MIQALEAVRALEEGVLTDIREGDVGAILGWGFMPWSGGPFSWLDILGAARAVEIADALAAAHGARFAAAALPARPGRAGRELLRTPAARGRMGPEPAAQASQPLGTPPPRCGAESTSAAPRAVAPVRRSPRLPRNRCALPERCRGRGSRPGATHRKRASDRPSRSSTPSVGTRSAPFGALAKPARSRSV